MWGIRLEGHDCQHPDRERDRARSGARRAHPMVGVSEGSLGVSGGDRLLERRGLHNQRSCYALRSPSSRLNRLRFHFWTLRGGRSKCAALVALAEVPHGWMAHAVPSGSSTSISISSASGLGTSPMLADKLQAAVEGNPRGRDTFVGWRQGALGRTHGRVSWRRPRARGRLRTPTQATRPRGGQAP